jgi:CubicO group peptidase (beta-lactamase class C family)
MRVLVLLALLVSIDLSSSLGNAQESAGDWATATADAGGLSAARLTAMEDAVRSGAFKQIGSVVIARHGKIIYQAYFEGDAGTLRDTRSATKSITSILIGRAIDDRVLAGVNTPVLRVLPDRARKLQNRDPRKSAMTIEDFLTMSSPLECDDWNDASRGNEERMYLVEDWAQFVLDLPIRGRSHLGEAPEPAPFGRYFSYCTGGVFVLSEILTKVTHARTDRYAEERLFRPLGIHEVTWVYSPMNVPQTGGGLRMTSRDLLKLVQLYLDGGQWHGTQIVDHAWVRASLQPHAQIDAQTQYGYLWWLKSFSANGKTYPAFYMSGNGGNKALGFPSLDMAVVITSTNYNTPGMHAQTERLLTDFILDALPSAER